MRVCPKFHIEGYVATNRRQTAHEAVWTYVPRPVCSNAAVKTGEELGHMNIAKNPCLSRFARKAVHIRLNVG